MQLPRRASPKAFGSFGFSCFLIFGRFSIDFQFAHALETACRRGLFARVLKGICLYAVCFILRRDAVCIQLNVAHPSDILFFFFFHCTGAWFCTDLHSLWKLVVELFLEMVFLVLTV